MKCKECGSQNINTKKNFTHGKGSKAITSQNCSNCNSSNIEIQQQRRFFRKRK